MKFRLIPREEVFFDLLDQIAQYLVDGAAVFEELAKGMQTIDKAIEQIKSLEQACDEVCHVTLKKLETTFITPLDREDIHELTLRLDDVIDMTTAAAWRMWMYGVTELRTPVHSMSQALNRQAILLKSAIARLRLPRKRTDSLADCIEINRLENEADEIFRLAMRELFEKEKDAVNIVRWKDIFQTLEDATDRAEEAANVIQRIVVKNA